MCYSQPLSVSLALAGWSIVAWLALRRRPLVPLVVPLAFYAFMETVQAAQYGVLDQCGTSLNRGLTFVAHALVVVQPCMWNLYRMVRAKTAAANALKKADGDHDGERSACQAHLRAAAVFRAAAAMSVVWAVCFTMRLLPPSPFRALLPATATFDHLRHDEIMVGPTVCTRGGPTHLYWTLPYAAKNGLEANFWAYLVLWFYPAVHEPRGYIKLAYWLAQVAFVNFTAGSIHELPTTWCALSVPILLLVLYLDRDDVSAPSGGPRLRSRRGRGAATPAPVASDMC